VTAEAPQRYHRSVLTFDAVSKSYNDAVALDRLSLVCEAGEVLGLLGPNGAGKSTAFAIAGGLLRPDAGGVMIAGHDADRGGAKARRRLIGAAPQRLGIYPELTGFENLVFFGRLFGVPRREAYTRAAELLERVGLAPRAARRAKTYSGGMARRLNLAAALMHQPKVVLLDEPTAGVDPQSRAAILDLVRETRDAGAAVLYTTHYIDEAQRLCDRVAVIDHGKLLAVGAVEHLIGAHCQQSTVIVETTRGVERRVAENAVAEVATLLGRDDVRGVRVERPDLETVFLDLTGRSLRDA
jgi:ABC-2 type transport system ATP-binding protein